MVVDGLRADAARALAAEGAAVVLLGTDASLGRLATEIVEAGGRAAVFTGDADDPDDRGALAELVAELFPSGSSTTSR